MKIFISSTYEDLKDHRNLIIESFQKFAIDINAMELWYSKPDTPLDVCLDNVSNSDIYIGIIAHRYGSVDNKTGKSITELEYDKAKEKELNCLIFIMDDDYSIKPKFIDKGKKNLKLKIFKEKLMSEHHLSFFKSPKDLLEKVVTSIKNLMKEKNIEGIEEFNIKKTWKDMKSKWKAIVAPVDMKIDFNFEQDIKESIDMLEYEIEGIEDFHDYISDSYSKMEEDLKQLLEKLEIDKKRIEEIPYYQNPFINRDWEMITFFPNRIKKLKLAVLQIKLSYLHKKAEESMWSKELKEKIKKTKLELENVNTDVIYID